MCKNVWILQHQIRFVQRYVLVSLNTSLLCFEKWYPIRIYTYQYFVNTLREISKRSNTSVFDRDSINI